MGQAEGLVTNSGTGERYPEAPGEVTDAIWTDTGVTGAVIDGDAPIYVVVIGLSEREPVVLLLKSHRTPLDSVAFWFATKPLGNYGRVEDALDAPAGDGLEEALSDVPTDDMESCVSGVV
ncbi:MAG: hypothetical protein OEO79_18685 [Gemmatimonadota bacterium]|nr:hypothetical protein [Gemmatimonadota bacterium]